MANLRFLSLNCHGLTADIISYLSSTTANYDFVLLQETWLTDFNSHRLGLISDDFEVFHFSAMEDKLRSGIFSGRPFGGQPFSVGRALLAGYPWPTPLIPALQLFAYTISASQTCSSAVYTCLTMIAQFSN